MDLEKKHEFRVVDSESWYRIHMLDDFQTPEMMKYVRRQKEKTGKDFPPADLEPKRVCVLNEGFPVARTSGFYYLRCVRISWAQHILNMDSAVRGALPRGERFHTLAVKCVMFSSDEKFIVWKRSDKVHVYPNMWDVVPAGWQDADRSLDEQIYAELYEEAGIAAVQVQDVVHLGLCEHLANPFIEVCVLIRVDLPAQKILEYMARADDSWEGKEKEALTPDGVRQMLEAEKFVPAGAATLMLALGMRPGL